MFDIFMDSQVVGHAKAEKEGLYYRITCTCTPPDSGMYRIMVSDGDNTRDLGICIPSGTVTRLPIKYLPGDDLAFTLIPKDKPELTVAVETDKPFEHLDQLETAHLTEEGMILIDPTPIPQDSDLSQESPHIWEQP